FGACWASGLVVKITSSATETVIPRRGRVMSRHCIGLLTDDLKAVGCSHDHLSKCGSYRTAGRTNGGHGGIPSVAEEKKKQSFGRAECRNECRPRSPRRPTNLHNRAWMPPPCWCSRTSPTCGNRHWYRSWRPATHQQPDDTRAPLRLVSRRR